MRLIETIKKQHVYVEHPAFWTLFTLKVIAGSLFASHYLKDLFIPFVQYFVESGFANPWNEFLQRGVLDAFPYSSIVLMALTVPQALGAALFGGVSHIPWNVELFLIHLPLLVADLVIYLVLCDWFKVRWRSVLLLYWCSPVLFYINYVHGQVDAIPTAFLILSLWLATRGQSLWSGLMLASGIGAKFHVAAAIPLLALAFFRTSKRTDRAGQVSTFLGALCLGVLLSIGPLLASPGYRTLVLGAKETQWVYALSWTMPQGMKILFCPLAVIALILHIFSYQRITRDILILYTGLMYTLLIVLVPPMPGWAYWSIPFLCYFLVRHDFADCLPFWIYNLAYLVYFIFFAPGIGLIAYSTESPVAFVHARDLCFTAMQASLALVMVWMYRVGVKTYVKYRHSHPMIAIGIGGDSASGKHTLAETLMGVTGAPHTIRLHGDDYHRWPRDHEAWKEQTHLDPRSNYFRQPVQHIEDLKNGAAILKPSYDHTQGTFTDPQPVEPNRFILFEGLHPFLVQRMRDIFDIKIFLSTEEPLRRQWKIARDTSHRGHSAQRVQYEIERREPDSSKYIRPQADYADWVIEYALPDLADAAPSSRPSLRVSHHISTAVTEIETVVDELSKCAPHGLRLKSSMDARLMRHVVEVQGTLSAQNVSLTAHAVFPNLWETMGNEPQWQADLDGVNQLIFLAFLHKTLVR